MLYYYYLTIIINYTLVIFLSLDSRLLSAKFIAYNAISLYFYILRHKIALRV